MDLAQFAADAAEKQAAYRLVRKAWAEEIGRPYPKRKKRDLRPDPGSIELQDEELG